MTVFSITNEQRAFNSLYYHYKDNSYIMFYGHDIQIDSLFKSDTYRHCHRKRGHIRQVGFYFLQQTINGNSEQNVAHSKLLQAVSNLFF